ncbi:MAG: GFA family protein [Arenimonas sp.]
MPGLETMISLQGGCHCEAVKIEFSTANPVSSTHPRACDCSFCQKHGAAYLSDSHGALLIACNSSEDLLSYRQGSENAQFLMCVHCGVLVAVIFHQDAIVYGAVNAKCLDRFAEFSATETSSPQLLDATDKVSRWTKLWVTNVSFAYARQ